MTFSSLETQRIDHGRPRRIIVPAIPSCLRLVSPCLRIPSFVSTDEAFRAVVALAIEALDDLVDAFGLNAA